MNLTHMLASLFAAAALLGGKAIAQSVPSAPPGLPQAGPGSLPPVAPKPIMHVQLQIPLDCAVVSGDNRALVAPKTTWATAPERVRISVSVPDLGWTSSAVFTLPSPWAPGGLIAPVPLPSAVPENPNTISFFGTELPDPNSPPWTGYTCKATYEVIPTTIAGNALLPAAQIAATLKRRPADLQVTQVKASFPTLNRSFDIGPAASPASSIILATGSGKPAGTPLGPNLLGIARYAADNCATPLPMNIEVTVRNAGGAVFDAPKPLPDGNTVWADANGMTPFRGGVSPLPALQSKTVTASPALQPAGAHTLTIDLNKSKAGGEQNFANNTWSGQFTVNCGPLQGNPSFDLNPGPPARNL